MVDRWDFFNPFPDPPTTGNVICYLYHSDDLCTCSFPTPEYKIQLELEIIMDDHQPVELPD